MGTEDATKAAAQETPNAAAKPAIPASDPAKPAAPSPAPAADAGKGTTPAAPTPAVPVVPPADTKPGEVKPGEQKPVAPAAIALQLPKDSLLNAEHVAKVTALAKERNWSQEQAQLVLDRDSQNAAQLQVDFQAKRTAWKESLKANKDFGGERLPETVEKAKRVLDRFFSPEFKKQLDLTGLGDNDELILGLAKIGEAAGEDKAKPGGKPSQDIPKSAARTLYPKMKSVEDSTA